MSSRSRSTSPSPLLPGGLNTKPTPRYSSRRNYVTFIATAVASGLFFHLLFVGFGGPTAVRDVPVLKDWLPQTEVKVVCSPDPKDPIHTRTHTHTVTASADRPDPTPVPITHTTAHHNSTAEDELDEEVWTLDQLREMVSKTKGYYARDYSLGLGWNNVSGCASLPQLQS